MERERAIQFLVGWTSMGKFPHHKSTRNPIPQHGTLPLSNKQMDAIAPRRRRMAPSSRSRTIFSCTGRSNIGEQMDLHKLNPSYPPHKSFAELFQKRPFPSFPSFPPFPPFPASHAPHPPKSQSYLSKMRRIRPRRVSDTLSVRRNLPTVRMERMSPGTSWMSGSSAGR